MGNFQKKLIIKGSVGENSDYSRDTGGMGKTVIFLERCGFFS